ncbi:MAG TPA: ABC transporter permease [Thermoanaerobaculia bacterium]|jgi:ABC-2 type transport system permease protein|nr:ABC transporter permease [Thermoanaerobaculia bacterium]
MIPSPALPHRNLLRIYGLEAKYEFLKQLRMPAYVVPTLVFPLFFYILFGLGLGRSGGGMPVGIATYLLATYGAFGVMAATLFGFGVQVALERGQGWMLFKRATPMPPMAYFTAKTAMSLLFGAIIVAALFTLGLTAGGVRLSLATWLALGGTLIAGALPFCAFGLAIGYFAGPNSAPAVVNMIYLPVSFCSGLWMPIRFLPGWMQTMAHFLPPYHYSQLALRVVGGGTGEPVGRSLLVLAVFTALSLAAARIGFRRDEGRTYG